jgi:hypothetical protein
MSRSRASAFISSCVIALHGLTLGIDAAQFLEIAAPPMGQKVSGRRKISALLVCVYVWLGMDRESDKFYVFCVGWLQDLIEREYKPRFPPKNVKSTHFALHPKKFEPTDFLNNWKPVHEAIAAARSLKP